MHKWLKCNPIGYGETNAQYLILWSTKVPQLLFLVASRRIPWRSWMLALRAVISQASISVVAGSVQLGSSTRVSSSVCVTMTVLWTRESRWSMEEQYHFSMLTHFLTHSRFHPLSADYQIAYLMYKATLLNHFCLGNCILNPSSVKFIFDCSTALKSSNGLHTFDNLRSRIGAI